MSERGHDSLRLELEEGVLDAGDPGQQNIEAQRTELAVQIGQHEQQLVHKPAAHTHAHITGMMFTLYYI